MQRIPMTADGYARLEEELRQPESRQNVARRTHRLVGQHRHLPPNPVADFDLLQRLQNAVIRASVVELVLAIIEQEVIQRFLDDLGVCGVAQRAPYEHGSAIADVSIDHFQRQLLAAEVAQHGVHRVGKIEF